MKYGPFDKRISFTDNGMKQYLHLDKHGDWFIKNEIVEKDGINTYHELEKVYNAIKHDHELLQKLENEIKRVLDIKGEVLE